MAGSDQSDGEGGQDNDTDGQVDCPMLYSSKVLLMIVSKL